MINDTPDTGPSEVRNKDRDHGDRETEFLAITEALIVDA